LGININHSKNTIRTENDLTIDATNNISVSDSRIVNLQDPVDLQDAVTLKYLQDTIADLTILTEQLLPQTPPVISSKVLDLIGDGPYRITDFAQVDNTGTGLSANPGDIVSNVLRNNDYLTNTLTQIGPGDSGTLSVIRNGLTTATFTFDDNVNDGSYTDVDTITITNNVDYGTITGDALGFSQAYNVRAQGLNTVPSGWNQIRLEQEGETTNTVTWYSDQTSIPAPAVTNISVTPSTTQNIAYSSSIPHYTSAQEFDVSFDVSNLSGDFYPATDTFFDGITPTSGSGINAVSDLTYQAVGMPAPLPRNYLVGSTYNVSTSTTVASGTGISNPGAGPRATLNNSYATTTTTFGVSERILYLNTSLTTKVNELIIPVINVGFGSGDARRVETIGGDTPVQTTFTDYNSQTSTLNAWDATVVGGILSHDTTNYSTGYLPAGPDLSTGRTGTQYFEVAFNRVAVSKFAIQWTGKASGCWIKLPGTAIDSTSTLNGWLDATIPYEGSGVPGENTTVGGNGTNGCGLGGIFTTGSQVTNQSIDITFGTESSSNATGNIIVVRFKLEDGDAITSLKFVTAS